MTEWRLPPQLCANSALPTVAETLGALSLRVGGPQVQRDTTTTTAARRSGLLVRRRKLSPPPAQQRQAQPRSGKAKQLGTVRVARCLPPPSEMPEARSSLAPPLPRHNALRRKRMLRQPLPPERRCRTRRTPRPRQRAERSPTPTAGPSPRRQLTFSSRRQRTRRHNRLSQVTMTVTTRSCSASPSTRRRWSGSSACQRTLRNRSSRDCGLIFFGGNHRAIFASRRSYVVRAILRESHHRYSCRCLYSCLSASDRERGLCATLVGFAGSALQKSHALPCSPRCSRHTCSSCFL
jgi:hypothetical protein